MSNVFAHSGDFGDAISFLPVIRQLGGGELVLCNYTGHGAAREPFTEARANFLLPLLAAQSYITSARFGDKGGVTHDSTPFRAQTKYRVGENLACWHARHFKIRCSELNVSPWLKADPSPETAGKVIMARSPRYHGTKFPWPKFMAEYGNKAVFIGLPDEHAAFTKDFGQIPHAQVRDALHMAQLIAGSDVLICNQSLPCWIALGLGHAMIQETWLHAPNSTLPKKDRPNVKYVF